MRIDPAIAALRADPGLQRRAQGVTTAAIEAWRARRDVAAALGELDRFGAGAPLEACPALEALFTAGGSAFALADAFCATMAETLSGEAFGQVPLRHGFDGTVSTLLLARRRRAHLVLHAIEPGDYTFERVTFTDGLRYEAVLAGDARARIVRRAGEDFEAEPLALGEGARLALDLFGEALEITEVSRRLVTLRLHRNAAEPRPSEEHALAGGGAPRKSSGDIAASRREMMLAVLGRMNCARAAPTMAQIAREEGEPSLRWEALRECLALDTAEGYSALLAIARSADDPLAAPAGALRAQLVEAHPQLLALETPPCPA